MVREAVILAGGLGTRLRAISGDVPKPLVLFKGKPFLYWLIKGLVEHGVERIILSCNYKIDEFNFFVQNYSFGADVCVVGDADYSGTGGAILSVLSGIEEDFVVVNGDTLFDFSILERDFRRTTIFCSKVADNERYGGIEVSNNGFCSSVDSPGSLLVSMGVVFLSKSKLTALMPDFARSRSFDLYGGLLNAMLERGELIDVVVSETEFLDFGTVESYKSLHSDAVLSKWAGFFE